MFQIIAYIKFIFSTTKQKRIFSSFVSDLVTQCFDNKKQYSFYNILNDYRKRLYQNHQTIIVTDFGSGSRVFKSNKRKIAAIAKNAGLTKKRAQLLARITRHLKPVTSLEIGTSLGLGTSAIHLGHPLGKITTLEGCPETHNIAQHYFSIYNFSHISCITGEFNEYLNTLDPSSKFDLIYFDGNHQKEATLNYFNTLIKHSHNNSVFIFDDIHWSKDMEDAWEKIKKDPRVKITIDTFYWGIIFFRNENKHQEHFKIRL